MLKVNCDPGPVDASRDLLKMRGVTSCARRAAQSTTRKLLSKKIFANLLARAPMLSRSPNVFARARASRKKIVGVARAKTVWRDGIFSLGCRALIDALCTGILLAGLLRALSRPFVGPSVAVNNVDRHDHDPLAFDARGVPAPRERSPVA